MSFIKIENHDSLFVDGRQINDESLKRRQGGWQMAKAIAGIMALLLTMGSFAPVLAGDWTAHGFIYKPSPGARGTVEKGRYDSGQDRVDARLNKEIWVGDPNYGTTIQDALTAMGSAEAILKVPAGIHSISGNLIVPSNITLKMERKATLAVPQGVTLTINGGLEAGLYQIFSCAGTGKVVFGRPNGVKELYPQWWGAKGDGIADDIIPLQAMVDCSVDSGGIPMYLPGGAYKITDTWKLNKGVSYAGFSVRGSSGSSYASTRTLIDATAFGDRPAINIQGARNVVVSDMYVQGKNVMPVTVHQAWANDTSNTPRPVNKNSWITTGCVDSRHSPYAGIAVDAYFNAAPGDPYPNDPYGRTVSSGGVVFNNVKIQGFVVGLMLAPWDGNDVDCASITINDSDIMYNTYGYSCGSGQARGILFNNTNVWANWCCITTVTHGNQQGICPTINGGILFFAWKIFQIGAANGNNAKTFSGVHCEGFDWLGEFGVNDSGSSEPTKFVGCHFSWPNYYANREPHFFIANQQMYFDSCYIGYPDTSRQLLNFYNSHYTRFTNCMFAGFDNSPQGVIGLSPVNGGSVVNLTEFDGCEVERIGYASSGYRSFCINNEFKDGAGSAARRFIGPFTHTVRLWAGHGFTNYKVSPPLYGFSTGSQLGISGIGIAGTNHGAVLTFTANSANDWKTGDMIFWQVPDRAGTLPTMKVPAFRVTVTAGTAITAVALVDGFDAAYNPGGFLEVAIPLFFNATESTGNTHTNTTIDSVTEITNWAVGDWIQGAGIPLNTRITNIVGTTITLSKATTATAAGVALYNCRLTAM